MPGPLGWLAAGAGVAGPVGGGVGVGAGPDGARVVAVPAAEREVTVVELARPLRRAVVAVLLGAVAADVGVDGGAEAAAVVAVVSVPGALELVVLPGGPATANWPPRRNDGGPLCVICQPMTPAAMTVTEARPATTFTRKE